MDTAMIKRKRRRLTICIAVLGLLVATIFFAYFETDPLPGSPMALWAAGVALVLCPGSLLFVTWIDIEPQTTAFAIVWVIIGLINFALYWAIGAAVGRSRWRIDKELPETADAPRTGT